MEAVKKTKVLFFGKLPPPFIGPAVATQKIINSDLKNRFNLVFFDLSHHKSIADLGKFSFSNFTSAFGQYFKLIKMLREHQPDLVYIPSQQTTVAYLRDIPFWIITKWFGKKLITHLRGGYFKKWYENETGPLMKSVVKFWQKRIDAQIVLGDNLINMYSDLMPVERIHVVPNAGDYDIPSAPAREEDVIRVLFLGNFKETKGVLNTMESFFLLKPETQKKVKFLFAGNWHEQKTKEKMEAMLTKDHENRIEIVGPVSGAPKFELLASCDVFIFPSFYRNEGHPWVLVEAIAAGLAVISTDHAAISQTVVHEHNGFLVEKQQPEQIAERLEQLVVDKELREKHQKASRRLYETEFTEANIVDNFSKVFNTVLDRKN